MNYKMKDILSEEDTKRLEEEECLLCEVHKRAYDKIKDSIICPHCNKYIARGYSFEESVVVGETNYYEPEQKLNRLTVDTCRECGGYYALRPEKIQWNANHDVYYTGGKDYLITEEDESNIFNLAQDKFEKSLRQFIEIKEKGENLAPLYPASWIRRDMEHAIAEYLYKVGLKK